MNNNRYSETFSIPAHLVGLALGDHNMKKARSLKGISNIFYKKKDHTITITGYNKEIVNIVRDVLEYSERDIPIVRCLGDLLQHNNDKLIQHIVNTSGLVRAELRDEDVDKPSEKRSEFVNLKFVGTTSSIDEAKVCIKTLMASDQFSQFQSEQKEAAKKPHAKFTEQFTVAGHLVGLAIGNKGVNIENARKLSGIVKIEQQDEDGFAAFNVYSNSFESVKRAREMLEIAEERLFIPPNKAGLVIGSGGATIKDIIKTTKVLRVEVKEKEPSAEGWIPVVIIGQPTHIEAAKLCIESKVPTRKE